MAIAHARPNPLQTKALDAGISAASAWLSQAAESAADYRDSARCAFVRSLEEDDSNAAAASIEFNRGFARGFAQAIAGARHG